ncbi:hypothetical protein ACFSTC_02940 [Nonomuraea ferruginea]
MLLALFVAVVQIQGALVHFEGVADFTTFKPIARQLDDFGNAGYVLLIVGGLALAARHRWPVAVFAVVALANAVYYSLGFPDQLSSLALFIALYTLAAYGDGRRSLQVAAGGASPCSASSGWSPRRTSSRGWRSAGSSSGSAPR